MADALPERRTGSDGKRRPVPPRGYRADIIRGVQVIRELVPEDEESATAELIDGPDGLRGKMGTMVMGSVWEAGPDGMRRTGSVQFPGTDKLQKERFTRVVSEEQLQKEQEELVQKEGAKQAPAAEVVVSPYVLLVKRGEEEIFAGMKQVCVELAGGLLVVQVQDASGLDVKEGDVLSMAAVGSSDVSTAIRGVTVVTAFPMGPGMHIILKQATEAAE